MSDKNFTIYGIRCLQNTKVYIGSTENYKIRMQKHFNDLSRGEHYNKFLQADYDKFGDSSFESFVLHSGIPWSKRFEIEKKEIEEYDALNPEHGYNIIEVNREPTTEKAFLSITLPRKLKEQLRRKSSETGKPINALIEEACIMGLQNDSI